MAYVAMAIVFIISFYTVLFGFEQRHEKNYSGFFAIILLALVVAGLPFYILFMKG